MRINNPSLLTIGLDVGYGVTKAVTPTLSLAFPSVAGPAREIKYMAEKIAQNYPGDQLTDDDGEWFVGDLALSQVPDGQLIRLRGRTANNDEFGNAFRVRMAKTALGKLLPGQQSGDVIHIKIATGLPVDHMREADALKAALLGQHHIKTDSTDFIANVSEVSVMPQPYGVIYANTLRPGGRLNTAHTAIRTGVVDVGMYTVDVALDDDGEYVDSASGSVESGVYTAQERIASLLERTYHEKPSYKDVEQVLRTGKYRAFGIVQDYSTEVAKALEPLRNATLSLLNDKFKIGSKIDRIYLGGGGSVYVLADVKATYPQAVETNDPQLAIARGYLNYVEFVACQSDVL